MDGWWSTRTDGWCACRPVACGGRRSVFVAVDAVGWMVVVVAVKPGDVKKKKKFYLRGWIAVDVCGWWPFRRAVAVVAIYTADVEEERKKKKKEKTYCGGCWQSTCAVVLVVDAGGWGDR